MTVISPCYCLILSWEGACKGSELTQRVKRERSWNIASQLGEKIALPAPSSITLRGSSAQAVRR